MGNSRNRYPVWKQRALNKTQTGKLIQLINKRHTIALRSYDDLHRYSVTDETTQAFWIDLFLFLGIVADKVPTQAYAPNAENSMFPPPRFFPSIALNFAENILAGRDHGATAIHACFEGGTGLRTISWGELYSMVEQTADAMKASGIGVGDRVAAVISNRPETVVLCLAALSLGALWSSSSPDMGEQGIFDRLLQIRPKLVFGDSSILYNDKIRDLKAKHMACATRLSQTPEFLNYVLIEQGNIKQVSRVAEARMITFQEFLRRAKGRKLTFEQLPFSHPGFIVYSSGTTGQPKCIVHSAAGLLLQVKKDSVLGFDARPTDIVLQYTTTGWIMWAMVLCGLAFAKEVVIYDGSPMKPDKLVLFRLVERLKVNLFGTSARFLSDLKAEHIKPKESVNLASLRTITSTGSTLSAEVCDWFYEEAFPSHIHLVSTCGGTDLACSLVSGNPTLPVYSGEIQCKSLGMAVDVADVSKANFASIESSGDPGELVCTKPFPSQPVMLWGTDGAKRYENTYFARFGQKVWNQGDFAQVTTDTKGYLMLGRSDGVLNPSGVRFGSAEIYEIVEKITEVEDSICVGQRRARDTDESVVLFVKTKENKPLTGQLRQKLKQAIRHGRTPRHVPKYIFQVPEIPYTINAKKIEIAVKQIISGTKVTPSGAVANPDCLKLYERYINVEQADKREAAALAKL